MFVFWKIIFEPWFAFLEADKPYMITNCYFLLGHAFMDGDRHYCVHTGMFMCGKFFLALIGIFNANWHFFDWTDIFFVDRKNFLIVECPFWVCTRQWSLQSAEEAIFEQIGFFLRSVNEYLFAWMFIFVWVRAVLCCDKQFWAGTGYFVLGQSLLITITQFCAWMKPLHKAFHFFRQTCPNLSKQPVNLKISYGGVDNKKSFRNIFQWDGTYFFTL